MALNRSLIKHDMLLGLRLFNIISGHHILGYDTYMNNWIGIWYSIKENMDSVIEQIWFKRSMLKKSTKFLLLELFFQIKKLEKLSNQDIFSEYNKHKLYDSFFVAF